MTLKIGVDTGGTYTDAVLFDDVNGLLCKAKALTTPHDLAEGIGEALMQLPADSFADVQLVSLSTTLATNAVVEGRGAPICTLLPGYTQNQVDRSGLADILRNDPVVLLAGGHNAAGIENAPLDRIEAERIIRKYAADVSAFAVSSMFGGRNPAHEIALRELIKKLCNKPVTCGHELSVNLNAPRRALTAALNARLTPFIGRLVAAVKSRLAALSITAPLMMVKGDGSLISIDSALERPVDTVLSGPAASVVGACYLSGRQNALVADMGGTTTDIAVVSNGSPRTRIDGALIGSWHPMVETLSVFSIGLGGDSEVRYSGGEGIGIGPRRVVPTCLLATQYPDFLQRLEAQDSMGSSPQLGHFAIRLYDDPVLIARLDSNERRVLERLINEAPLSVEKLAAENSRDARVLARLVRSGLAIYSGFTPTDAAHVLGLSHHWDSRAAHVVARIWARQMRHRYGYGNWKEGDSEAPSRSVLERMKQLISEALVRTSIRELDGADVAPTDELVQFLSDVLGESTGRVLSVSFNTDYPLLAVGAPARVFFPDAARHLGAWLDVPNGADVAGAVGSVASKVVQRARTTVTQPSQGLYRVHATEGPRDFEQLDLALSLARELSIDAATSHAKVAGAINPKLTVEVDENRVDHDIDGSVFFEATVCATATGVPGV
ncbi:MAG: hydantoinase [marine bacterium B5-7]|nr:MAG: hydantoinase [marine bacterium B5-7]